MLEALDQVGLSLALAAVVQLASVLAGLARGVLPVGEEFRDLLAYGVGGARFTGGGPDHQLLDEGFHFGHPVKDAPGLVLGGEAEAVAYEDDERGVQGAPPCGDGPGGDAGRFDVPVQGAVVHVEGLVV